jgi:hypothetical protein
MIKQNLGNTDRLVRIISGAGLLALAFVGPQTPWGYLGLVLQHNLTLGLATIVAWDLCPERTLHSTQDWKDGTNGPILRHPKVKL